MGKNIYQAIRKVKKKGGGEGRGEKGEESAETENKNLDLLSRITF